MYELREYQADALDDIMYAWDDAPKARIMYQLPTGGGKTAIGGEVAGVYLEENKSARVVWITHRRELEEQSSERLIKEHGIPSDRLVVTSPLRAKREAGESREGDLLIVDEAHHSVARTWGEVILNWRGAVLGLTATPYRLSKKEGFTHMWNRLFTGVKPRWLTDNGYLSEAAVMLPPKMHHIHGKGRNRGEYSMKATYEDDHNRVVMTETALDWAGTHDWNRMLVYAVSVPHAQAFHAEALKRGYTAGILTGRDDRQYRNRVVEMFRTGRLDMLVNVEIVTEGFDCPEADAALILRPTESLALWLQMCGRVLRPAEGKPHGLILDAAANLLKHGHPLDDQKWDLEARGDLEDGEAPTMMCGWEKTDKDGNHISFEDGCGTWNSISAQECVFCHKPFGKECPTCKWRPFGDFDDSRADGRCSFCCPEAQQALLVNEESHELLDRLRSLPPNQKGNLTWTEFGFRWWANEKKNRSGVLLLTPEAERAWRAIGGSTRNGWGQIRGYRTTIKDTCRVYDLVMAEIETQKKSA